MNEMSNLLCHIALLALVGSARCSDSGDQFRIWLDEYVFRPGELNLMQQVINASDGSLVLAGRTVSRVIVPKGHKMLHRHDFLWTGRDGCYAAFREPKLTPGNTISCTPGTEAITGKRDFIKTMHAAYGQHHASTVMPTAFLLPQEYNKYASYILNTRNEKNDNNLEMVWALKEDIHRGKGVIPASGLNALGQSLSQITIVDERKRTTRNAHRFVIAQRFIKEQFLVHGRACVVRLWATLAGGNPIVRSYLFSGGIVVLGNPLERNVNDQKTNSENTSIEDQSQNLIVNLFLQNRSAAADPLSITELRAYLHDTTGSDATFQSLWTSIEKSVAAAFAASISSIRSQLASKSNFPYYQGGNTEVLGLDFVIDSSMKPWLIEVNYLPSMARKIVHCKPARYKGHENEEECKDNAMDLEKESFLAAYLRLVASRHKNLSRHAEHAARLLSECSEDEKNKDIMNAKPNSACEDKQLLPTWSAVELLNQVLNAEGEAQTARDLGFSDITVHVYEAMECISHRIMTKHTKNNGNNTSSSVTSVCDAYFLPQAGRNKDDDDRDVDNNSNRDDRGVTCEHGDHIETGHQHQKMTPPSFRLHPGRLLIEKIKVQARRLGLFVHSCIDFLVHGDAGNTRTYNYENSSNNVNQSAFLVVDDVYRMWLRSKKESNNSKNGTHMDSANEHQQLFLQLLLLRVHNINMSGTL